MTLNNIVEICVAIDIAILGIAYPIIIEKISNVGNKYSSNYLSNIFDKEFPQKSLGRTLPFRSRPLSIFEWVLFGTIISFIFLVISFEPLIWNESWIMQNSAKLLVLILSVLLVISFIIWLDKVSLYTGKATRLISYLIEKYQKRETEDQYKTYLLKTLNEFTVFSVVSQDDHLQESLSKFYAEEFLKFRKIHEKSKDLEYPIDFYELNYKVIKKFMRNGDRHLDLITGNIISNWWILGQDYEQIQISERTYEWMWRNIVLISEDSKLIKEHWKIAHQYFWMRLGSIPPKYILKQNKYENQDEIDQRNFERERYLEFHYAVGGLLLYQNNLLGLKKILNFTQSQPPSFHLLPQNMYSIFHWFSIFKDDFLRKNTPFNFKYQFPELESTGVKEDGNYWVCQYLALLFIRQFSLDIYFTYQNPKDQPALPNTQIDLINWQKSLDYFVYCINKVMVNKKLLKTLGYDAVVSQNVENFDSFLIVLRSNIDEAIQRNKISGPLSKEKISNFKHSSAKIILNGIEKFRFMLDQKIPKKTETIKFSFYGGEVLMGRETFMDDTIPHMNYDSILAEQVVHQQINRYIPNSFLSARTNRYLIEKKDLNQVLRDLKFDSEKHVIIGLNANGLNDEKFKSRFGPIKLLPTILNKTTLFILPKTDLPNVELVPVHPKEIEKYDLEKIDKDNFIYASVLDISRKGRDLTEQWMNDRKNLTESVLVTINILGHITWKKERKLIQISIVSPFEEQGIIDDISNIKPL